MKQNKRFGTYRFGFDATGGILAAILLLPNLVSWIMAAARRGYYNPYAENGANIAALVFLILGGLLLLSVVKEDVGKFSFSSPLATFTGIFLLLYYMAWVFYFCSYTNVAVSFFLAGCLPVCLCCYEADRKNWFAFGPTALFGILHITATALLWF